MAKRAKMTKAEAWEYFKSEVLPNLPKGDRPARDQAWNDYTDALCKDRQITQKQCDTWAHPFNR